VDKNVENQANILDNGADHSLHDCSLDDDSMSVERLDDAVAAITFTATVVTIALGFLFNL
jgi:hypothetical protein